MHLSLSQKHCLWMQVCTPSWKVPSAFTVLKSINDWTIFIRYKVYRLFFFPLWNTRIQTILLRLRLLGRTTIKVNIMRISLNLLILKSSGKVAKRMVLRKGRIRFLEWQVTKRVTETRWGFATEVYRCWIMELFSEHLLISWSFTGLEKILVKSILKDKESYF